MGTNLGRPDWLENEFQLPEGIEISLAINDDSTGERVIRGQMSGGDAEAIRAQQHGMLGALGYERVGDTDYFLRDGRPPIQLQVGTEGGITYYEFSHSNETPQTLRDVYAPFEGLGTMVAIVGDETYTYQGNCTLRSTSGDFNTDDATGQLTVEIRDGEQDYILGNISQIAGDTIENWGILQVDEAGNYPVVEVRGDGFSFEGFVVAWQFSNTTAARIDVNCPS